MSSYVRLSAESMRTISGLWLHDAKTRAVLAKFPKTAALVPDIEEAHRALCAALGGEDGSPLEAQLTALRAQAGSLDERHDRKYRGTYKLLDALIELADDPTTAEAILALRDRLLPHGVAHVKATWATEAGHAATVHAALDKATRAELKRFATVEGRTLDDEVQAWVKAGVELGSVAAQKASVEHQIANTAVASKAATLHDARKGWIKTVRALATNFDLSKDVSTEDRALVFGLLDQAANAAERRSARHRTDATDEDPATTKTDTTPSSPKSD